MMAEWVTIKIFMNRIEGEIARSVLDSCGIDARIFSDDVPQLQTAQGVKLQVIREQVDEAMKVLFNHPV
jgi:hypothetical protein